MDIQGHRGARGHLPENTLPAFALALEFGVDTVELDVGVSRDGVVVVHHDRRLNPDVARGADGNWVTAPAPTLHSLTYLELEKYDVGRIRPGSEYARRFPHQRPLDGTRIPTLADVFEHGGPTERFNIEAKISPQHPGETLAVEPFAHALIAEVRKAGMERRAQIQSFDFRIVKVVEREAPEIATAYLTEGKDSVPARVRAAGARSWSPDFRDLTPAVLAAARAEKLRVVVWTVNEPADILRMIEAEVDGIISDYPDRVIELSKRNKA
ncbi:MAG TPA: glycerophosphodiester phosphodiesterase [Burkholderiales bacterium]